VGFLERVIRDKRAEVAARRQRTPQEVLQAQVRRMQRGEAGVGAHHSPGAGSQATHAVRDFAAALRNDGPPHLHRVIAELKGRTPTIESFAAASDLPALATVYRDNGACAISIVVDEKRFGTSLSLVDEVRRRVDLPVLVKEFVIDPYQIWEARAAGADALLLMVRLVDDPTLREFLALVHELGMTALVETHDEADVERALAAGAQVIGVNNRDLDRLEVSLETARRLLPLIPPSRIRVVESGIHAREEVEEFSRLNADAFLVGGALLAAADPAATLRDLVGAPRKWRRTPPKVKICGLVREEDARRAVELGADFLGMVFAESPRRVSLDQARRIRRAVPEASLVGVFVDASLEEIVETAATCGLDYLQLHGHESPEDCALVARRTGKQVIKALVPTEPLDADFLARWDTADLLLFDLPRSQQRTSPANEGLGSGKDQGIQSGKDQGARSDGNRLQHSSEEKRRTLLWRILTSHGDIAPAGTRLRFFLAGGLEPGNVRRAIETVRPWAVDVSRGVESIPGVKDPAKLKRFIQEVRS